jgi:hypothetical protein
MKKRFCNLRLDGMIMGLAFVGVLIVPGRAGGQEFPARLAADLRGPFDLGAERTAAVQFFRMETVFVHIGFDGQRTGAETYILKLKCVPAALSGKGGDEYTCAAFDYRVNDGETLSIPPLAGWSYVFAAKPGGKDEKGQVFGIPHGKFEDLRDSRGHRLPVGIAYSVYNNFIDFHSFNDVFARPSPGGRGIQDLKTIGQKIIHAAAFTEPPVNLGNQIKEGSVFRNGEVSLEFKGLSVVDGAPCALVGYDSGESTLKMIMPLGPDKDIVTVGGSEYKGDLYIDLATQWARKVTMDEFVITQTRLPGPAPSVDSYTVRHLLLRLVGRQEFEKN